ncbi:MAG: c-type cytochrome [Pirellulaceae bacterium]
MASSDPNIRAIFESLLPPSEQPKRPAVTIDQLLAISGDPLKGAELLRQDGKLSDCLKCHRHGETGTDIGPELTKIGARLSRRQLIESLLTPSASVAASEFRQWTIAMLDGTVHSGIIVGRDAASLTLKMIDGRTLKLAEDEIDLRQPQTLSIMPEGRVNTLSVQEIADLIAFLHASR